MERRIDFHKTAPGVTHAMLGLEKYLDDTGLDRRLMNLVKLRASQINGCAYCIDMHWKDLRNDGETEQRLYGLDAWRESPYYTDRERAVLAWTEAVTQVSEGHVSDQVFGQIKRSFTDAEIVNLTLCVVAINGWNRLNVAFRTPGGSYEPVKLRLAPVPAEAQPSERPPRPTASH